MKLLWFALLVPLALFAQTDAASLRVLVNDPSEAIVVSATVELRDENTNRTFKQTSDAEGYATFSPLPHGTYSVMVAAPGFRGAQMRSVVLNVAERRLLRVALA